HAPEIQDEVRRDAQTIKKRPRWMRVALGLETDADDPRRTQRSTGTRRDECFLFRRQKQISRGTREEVRLYIHVDRGIFFGGRHEHGAIGHEWNAEEGG